MPNTRETYQFNEFDYAEELNQSTTSIRKGMKINDKSWIALNKLMTCLGKEIKEEFNSESFKKFINPDSTCSSINARYDLANTNVVQLNSFLQEDFDTEGDLNKKSGSEPSELFDNFDERSKNFFSCREEDREFYQKMAEKVSTKEKYLLDALQFQYESLIIDRCVEFLDRYEGIPQQMNLIVSKYANLLGRHIVDEVLGLKPDHVDESASNIKKVCDDLINSISIQSKLEDKSFDLCQMITRYIGDSDKKSNLFKELMVLNDDKLTAVLQALTDLDKKITKEVDNISRPWSDDSRKRKALAAPMNQYKETVFLESAQKFISTAKGENFSINQDKLKKAEDYVNAVLNKHRHPWRDKAMSFLTNIVLSVISLGVYNIAHAVVHRDKNPQQGRFVKRVGRAVLDGELLFFNHTNSSRKFRYFKRNFKQTVEEKSKEISNSQIGL